MEKYFGFQLLSELKSSGSPIQEKYQTNHHVPHLSTEQLFKLFWAKNTAWKVSKYGIFSGLYFPAISPNTRKYWPGKTSFLDTFHALKNGIITRKYSDVRPLMPECEGVSWSKQGDIWC